MYNSWMCKEAVIRWRDKFWKTLAWKVPPRLVYWCIIRAWAHATVQEVGDNSAPWIPTDRVIQRWQEKYKLN